MAVTRASIFGEVRSLLSQPMTGDIFQALMGCLGTMEDKQYLEAVLIPYCLDSPQLMSLDYRPFYEAPLHYWRDPRALLTNVLTVKKGEPGTEECPDLPVCMIAPYLRNIQWLVLDGLTWNMSMWEAFLAWDRLPQLKCLRIPCWGLSASGVETLLTQDLPKLEVLVLEDSYYAEEEMKTLYRLAAKREDFELVISENPEITNSQLESALAFLETGGVISWEEN